MHVKKDGQDCHTAWHRKNEWKKREPWNLEKPTSPFMGCRLFHALPSPETASAPMVNAVYVTPAVGIFTNTFHMAPDHTFGQVKNGGFSGLSAKKYV